MANSQHNARDNSEGAREEIRVSEIRYRRLFETARDGILILDANTSKITDSNPFMTELLGYSREELRGKELADIGLFQDEDAAHAAMTQLQQDSYIRYDDLPLESKSHQRRNVEFVSNVYDEGGTRVIQCNIRDITERRHAQEQQTRLAAIVSSSNDVIYSKDIQGIIVTWNQAGERLYGYSASEIVGKPYSKFVPDTHVAEYKRVMERLNDGEVIEPFETLSKRKDGTVVEVNTRLSPLLDAQGKIVGASVITRDLSEQHVQAAKIANSQAETQALNIRLRRAMTETHHRVKNNLQIIAAMLDMQTMDNPATIPTEAVKRLGSQVAALAAVHDLLTEEAKQDGEANSLNARQVLAKLIPLVSAATSKKVTFEGVDARISMRQASSLSLVANEIITNAIKHTRSAVKVRFEVVGADASLTVSDNGPGFPAGFDPESMTHNGLEMVCHLVRWDLSGSIVFGTGADGGGRVIVKIPHFHKALVEEAAVF